MVRRLLFWTRYSAVINSTKRQTTNHKPQTYLLLLVAVLLQFPHPTYAQSARSIVDSLASSYFGGRGYGDNQDSLAAAFIAEQFKSAGLSPLSNSYYQEFPLNVTLHAATPKAELNGVPLKLGKDFLPYPTTPSSSLSNFTKVVDVGTGLLIPDLGINEYEGKDISNAVVFVQDAVPDSIRTNPLIPAPYYSQLTRSEIAAQLGAKAIVFVSDAPLVYGRAFVPSSIPALRMKPEALPPSITSISIQMQSRLNVPVTTSNVIAYQKGTRYPDRYILLMGHYDHLGRLGPEHHFPGANDNASGIAMLIETARYFQDKPSPYSLVYIAFSGEEQGLVGSKYFVENPIIPLDSIRFLINVDMVASGTEGLMALGGNEFPAEYELLSTLNDSLQLGPLRKRSNAPNSDHYYFLDSGVRGFFFYTNKGTQPYHHMDDIPATLDWDEFKDTFLLLTHFIEALD